MHADLILFPTDFSEYSDAALGCASNLAQTSGATLVILHVQLLSPKEGEGMLHAGLNPHEQAELEIKLKAIRPTLPDVPHEHELLTGDPAKEIVRFARDEGVDLIVMGTHGRSGLSRLLMGSVAENVMRKAPCPVVTVKMPQEVEDAADETA